MSTDICILIKTVIDHKRFHSDSNDYLHPHNMMDVLSGEKKKKTFKASPVFQNVTKVEWKEREVYNR